MKPKHSKGASSLSSGQHTSCRGINQHHFGIFYRHDIDKYLVPNSAPIASHQTHTIDLDNSGRWHKISQALGTQLVSVWKDSRVLGKAAPGAPHEVLLVLDANQGQNALAQAKQFHEAVGVTGLVLTKLDGTAKGGIVLAIARQLALPIRFIGIGEGADDFGEFDAAAFARALVDGSGDARDT